MTGDALKTLLGKLGYTIQYQTVWACIELMNGWGPEGSLAHWREIITHLEAHGDLAAFLAGANAGGVGALVDEAIRNSVGTAPRLTPVRHPAAMPVSPCCGGGSKDPMVIRRD
jgi:hypothetical protein